MKVKDLIKELQECDQEAIVEVRTESGKWDWVWHVFHNVNGKVRLLP